MTTINKPIIAIVPAGGVGQRAGTKIPKQYQEINNTAMLRLTVMALLMDARISHVIVGVAADDTYIDGVLSGLETKTQTTSLDSNVIDSSPCKSDTNRVIYARTGGKSRADTVANTINYALEQKIIKNHDWVMVHDAARPGLPISALSDLIDKCLQYNRGGILAMPAADTVKHGISASTADSVNSTDYTASASNGFTLPKRQPVIYESLDRDLIWLAQTPQMFPALKLLQAIQKTIQQGFEVTDEAEAMELIYDYNALLVKGCMRNFKVTWPEDFDLIAKILNQPYL